MTDAIRIDVDPGKLFERTFTELEQSQLPYATQQAVNAVAYEISLSWKRTAARVFDRPVPLTINGIQYRKAGSGGGAWRNMGGGIGYVQAHPGTGGLFAEIYIRDEAHKGTPPAKYLLPEVFGGERRTKGFEKLLQEHGVMPANTFAVIGRGARPDAYGNLPNGQITAILSQLGALRDPLQNETAEEKANAKERSRTDYLGRNRQGMTAVMKKTVRRGGRYFALTRPRGKLPAGIYERIGTGFGSAVRSILIYTTRANYAPRFDIFEDARKQWNLLMPSYFKYELQKAVVSSKFGGGS